MVEARPKVPAWFKSLLSRAKTTAADVKVAVERKFCEHWWERTTIWVYNVDPEKRTVAKRTAKCILCGHTEDVASWKDFPEDTKLSSAERDAIRARLAEKASVPA